MDLNEIVIFAKVVQTGSFTAAARALDMPKSTVSRKISALEQRLGARLLQRTTRRLSLTDIGRDYHRRCQQAVVDLEAAEQVVQRLQEVPRGLLRVTAPGNAHYLAPVVAEYLRRYREARVEAVCSDRVVDLVEEGFDVALRAGALADSSLIARNLGWEWRALVAAPDYVRSRGVPDDPDLLRAHDCLLFGAGSERRTWRLQSAAAKVEVAVQARLTTNDLDLLQQAAVDGLGIAMLPAWRCGDDLAAGRLQRVLPDWRSPETPVHAVYPSGRYLSPKVSAFLDLLREHLSFSA